MKDIKFRVYSNLHIDELRASTKRFYSECQCLGCPCSHYTPISNGDNARNSLNDLLESLKFLVDSELDASDSLRVFDYKIILKIYERSFIRGVNKNFIEAVKAVKEWQLSSNMTCAKRLEVENGVCISNNQHHSRNSPVDDFFSCSDSSVENDYNDLVVDDDTDFKIECTLVTKQAFKFDVFKRTEKTLNSNSDVHFMNVASVFAF
jgi:hypothetical protein